MCPGVHSPCWAGHGGGQGSRPSGSQASLGGCVDTGRCRRAIALGWPEEGASPLAREGLWLRRLWPRLGFLPRPSSHPPNISWTPAVWPGGPEIQRWWEGARGGRKERLPGHSGPRRTDKAQIPALVCIHRKSWGQSIHLSGLRFVFCGRVTSPPSQGSMAE